MSPDPRGLIDTGGIAALLGCSRGHVTDRLTKKPGFPKPSVNFNQKLRRWDIDEVMSFLKTKERRPRRRP